MITPLSTLTATCGGSDPAVGVASWFLRTLGATSTQHASAECCVDLGPGGALLLTDDVEVPGIPPGTLDYAAGLVLAGAALLGFRAARMIQVSRLAVAAQLFLPQVMAASYQAASWPAPAAPRRFPGGALACELGSPDDEASFDRLLTSLLPGQRNAAAVAAEAQQWRLPVSLYRRRPATRENRPAPIARGRAAGRSSSVAAATNSAATNGAAANGAHGPAPLTGVSVVELATGWAGPLATWLLAAAGATVWKVEPTCRLDGFRSLDGRGIVPPGTDPASRGNAGGLFNALNRSKRRLDLDLRQTEARRELARRAAAATVVVDAFSPRVMPNFGLTRATLARGHPELLTVSMPSFPAGHPRREHVSYGTGIHAELGLGEQRDGSFQAPSTTYPDAIGGLAAFATIVALIVGRDRGWRPSHVEVPLLAASAPLLSFAGPSEDLAGDDLVGHRLQHDPRLHRGAWFEELTDGAGTHRYPRAPFAGAVASTPAPTLSCSGRE